MCKFLPQKNSYMQPPPLQSLMTKKPPTMRVQWGCNEKREGEKDWKRQKEFIVTTYLSIHVKDQLVPPRHVFFWLCWGCWWCCWCLCFLVESFAFSFLSCSFTLKDRDLRMISARLTKLESTRLRAHDDVLFDRLQILLGSPLSMLCFIVGLLFLERK